MTNSFYFDQFLFKFDQFALTLCVADQIEITIFAMDQIEITFAQFDVEKVYYQL